MIAYTHKPRQTYSYPKVDLDWIVQAKRPDTRGHRIDNALALMAEGKKLT